jgi:hypothetical protein
MFSGELDRGAFARQMLLRGVLCLVVAPLALLLFTLAVCATDKNACFSVSIVTGMFSAHFIYLLFALSCIGPIVRRLRRLQLPVFLLALPILFFFADVQSGASFIHSLVTRFVWPGSSTLAGSFYVPRHFLLALVSMLVLWILPDRKSTDQSLCERWGLPGLMTFGMLVLIGIGAVIEAVRTTSLLFAGVASVQAMATFMRYYYLYGSAIILVALAVLTARWQNSASSGT